MIPGPGEIVRFVDVGNVTSDAEQVVVAVGTCSGEPIHGYDMTYVPVYAERDNGREATTIMVAEANVLAVGEEAGGMGTTDGLGA